MKDISELKIRNLQIKVNRKNEKIYEEEKGIAKRAMPKTSLGYVYIDGIYLKRNWGGEFENVSILVAIGVDEDGNREVIGAAEDMKEDKESWRSFLVWLKSRGLDGVKLVVGDKNLGMCESVHEVFPEAKYQRCTVHFYRNIMSSVPRNRLREVMMMLKAIHA